MNLKWLFNRGCSCAELRERLSLAERGESLLRDEYCREHAERQAWQRTARIQGLLADRLEGKCERLEREVAMWRNRARHFEQKVTEETKGMNRKDAEGAGGNS